MKTRIVTVLAERTLDGKIVYRGMGGCEPNTYTKNTPNPRVNTPNKHIETIKCIAAIIGIILSICFSLFMFSVVARGTSQQDDASYDDISFLRVLAAPAYDGGVENAIKEAAQYRKTIDRSRIPVKEQDIVIDGIDIGFDDVDDDILEMLALVIYMEAGSDTCSDETRRMVGEVAMNRVADSRFPDTLEDVLLQKRQYGRLYWTGLVWPDRASKDAEAHAVQRAYDVARVVLSSKERLLPDDVIFQAEFPQGKEIVAESDGFYFCR